MPAIGHAREVVVEHGQGLQALDEALRIVVEDDSLVQQPVGVENLLQFLHHLVGLLAPLIPDEGCHVTARAVLSLQRTVILLDHQPGHVAHHLGITVHLTLGLETLVQDEMVVALEGMAVDTGIGIAVVCDEFLQFYRSLWQRLDGEGHVLDETRGSHGARTAHGGEDARADGPVLTIDGRILRELSRDVQPELTQTLLNLFDLIQQLLMRDSLGLRQDGRQVVVITRLHTSNLSSVHILLILQEHRIINGTERLVVEHLGTLHHQVLGAHREVFIASLQFLQRHHGLTALAHRQEVDHCRSFVGIVAQRLHGDLGQEGQCTLTAHHGVGDDVEGVVVGDERTEIESRHVLNIIFGTYARRELFVGTHTVAKLFYLLEELRMTLSESLTALLGTCVENGAVCQDDTRREEHPVAVGMHATVHARGIVADDAAHHRRTNRGGIGRKHPSIGLQYLIDTGTHDAWLQTDALLPLSYLVLLPVLACHDKHTVSTTLARERGTCSPESEGQLVFPA